MVLSRLLGVGILSLFLAQASGLSQGDTIVLLNPSFEDMPRNSQPPRGWTDCGFNGETPPDVQPGHFEVKQAASKGDTYLGMVVRDNETFESVGQRLPKALKQGQCYQFSLDICRSDLYVSQSRVSADKQANYITPVKVRIWGGSSYCDKAILLDETNLIINTRWLEYSFKFKPDRDVTYIVLEAYYKTPILFPYNGNVLIDNASSIITIPCNAPPLTPAVAQIPVKEEPVVNTSPSRNTTVKPEPPKPNEVIAANTPRADGSAKKEKLIAELDRKNLKKGQTIRIEKLYFEADKSDIQNSSYPALDELFEFMAANPDVIVEIAGHTNGRPTDDAWCDRLSTARAKAVADYLSGKGIPKERLQYKGYGKRQPIAGNDTSEGRRKNQRVEIKILSING